MRAPAEAEVFFAAAPSIAEGRAGAAEGPSPEVVLAAGATWAAAGFFVAAPSIAEGRAGAAEGPSPEVVLAAGATWGAEVFFAAAPSIAEGWAGAAEGSLSEVDLTAGATSPAACVGVCTAAPVETFAEAADARAASTAAGEQFTAAGAHGVESAHHFAGAAQATVPASVVGSDGRHRVSLPRDAAADRRERGEDLTRTDVRFAVEQLGFME